ncbi:N-acyl-L-amino acid amidohydrolase [Halorientalis sp. IM1011]|uniref:amidohydrolase n=1 Tax=Halorientalis sp. IM1011 TaxID=1932360 RepID=UPI00097CD55A|nr:amidohydrolase [Halorientalis sp. IM1011]AQL41876.1 N-acyl-L-amino acid amidohydrolase [Halorientalis sp. IM1011]
MHHVDRDRLVSLRREFHRHPEPAWREFRTTARVIDELEAIGVDDLLVGPEVLDADARMGVPDPDELTAWRDRAREAGVDPDLLDRLDGGHTGAIAVLDGERDGPTIALRVDIDGLPLVESDDPGHVPAAEGFRSETGAMHACGHDAHATIGLGVLDALSDRDFAGRLKVLFQPAEEVVGGAAPMAESGHLDDVDYLLALHIGLDHPTGEVVAGVEGFLAVSQFRADFAGESAHAGGHPSEGRNAVQAMAAAVQNLYSIPRNEAGATRVNAGDVGGGTASNIIPEQAYIEGEVRGETTDLMEYMRERADRVMDNAAAMHDCEVEIETAGQAPSAESDPELVDVVEVVAGRTDGVETVLRHDDLGGSEDATYLMRRVQDHGGNAAFVCVGTDHPGGHHTDTFDVDEDSLPVGVAVLADTITHLGREAP